MRLQATHTMTKDGALEAYYSTLDNQMIMFKRMVNPTPTMLTKAYTKEIEIRKQLGQ